MKILLFVPTYRKDGKLALLPETRYALDMLDHGDHDVTEWVSVDEIPSRKDNIFNQYQRAWKRANEEDFDAILTVEHDMIPPPDALVKLVEIEAGMVHGIYLFRESGYLNALSLNSTSAYFDRSLDNYKDERARAFSAGVWDVAGTGFGCTLIRREVFSKITLKKPRGSGFPDIPLSVDCVNAGIRQVARFDVACGHIRQDGFILWPNADGTGWVPYLLKVKIKSDFVGIVKDKRVHFTKGEIREVPGELVGGWAMLGLVDKGNIRD